MTAERWAHIKQIFSAAVELPEADRGAYLQSACGADTELRGEVERLLADHATQTLNSPAAGVFAQVPTFAPGEMLAQYRVEAKLGEGGMGAVYRAYDTRLQRQVAVKVLLPDPDQKRRLMREARAASALNHPNIVTVHEISSDRGVDFIAMEYVEGRSLDTLIPSRGLPVGRALDYAIQIADALAQAHAAGVVHRDLKPANIMVNGGGRIKLLDFGLARQTPVAKAPTATLTMPGTVMGTPAYMSPEQAEGRKTDHRTDVFSFGAVLYEMLAGRRAFAGDTTIGLLAAIIHQEPRPLREIAPLIPHELERMVGLCLKKDPVHRFQHMGDVKIQVEALQEDPVSATPGTFSRTPWLRAAVVAVLALILAAAGTLGRWLTVPPDNGEAQVLTRLTSDPGLTFQPAVSADGKLVAYSSDRGGAGNLDIWVQQVAGGDPIQVTRDPADDSDPAFSADGSQIAFRSKREGGGIYVVPALGGEARLISQRGKNPQFSADGSQIAFWVSTPLTSAASGASLASLLVVPSRGGSPRRLRPDFIWAGYPIWTPDGNHLLFAGAKERTSAVEWWVTPLDSGAAINTGTVRATESSVPNVFAELSSWVPKGWIGDSVISSSMVGDGSSLWLVPLSTKSWRVAGKPRRMTFGTGLDVGPSVSAGGRVVFASLRSSANVWEMAADVNRGTAVGEMQPLTREAGVNVEPALTPDGGTLAFIVGPRSRGRLRIRDLRSGKETAVSAAAPFQLYPSFSPDGSKAVFLGVGSRGNLYVVPARGGLAEKVCDQCGYAPTWSADGTKIAYDNGLPRFVGLLDLATGRTAKILRHSQHSLIQAQFSPEGNWICFALVLQATPGSQDLRSPATRLMVARFSGTAVAPESDWIPVSDGSGFDVRPRWSPDGSLLYFTSPRDGFRCIWAQRLDRVTKRPVGPPFGIRHIHDPQRLLTDPPELGFSVARDKMAFNLTERTGNIWMFQLP